MLPVQSAALAEPQRQTFPDANGRVLGRATTDARGNTTFYDAAGRITGRSVIHGNSTTVYDQMGRQMGNLTTKGK